MSVMPMANRAVCVYATVLAEGQLSGPLLPRELSLRSPFFQRLVNCAEVPAQSSIGADRG
jgi:hypothetical protein